MKSRSLEFWNRIYEYYDLTQQKIVKSWCNRLRKIGKSLFTVGISKLKY